MIGLSFKNVSYAFGRTVSQLKDVSFDIAPGEFVSIVGQSGAGKTTLLQLAGNLLQPTRGSIEWVDAAGQQSADQGQIGFVFQDFGLFPWLNAYDNVAFGLKQRGQEKHVIAQRVEQLLESFHLTDVSKKYPHQLSGGTKQRLAVARAIAQRPRMLCLDEPFSSLDPFLRSEAQEILKQALADSAMTTLMVTHDLEEAITLSNRILIVRAANKTPADKPHVDWFDVTDTSNIVAARQRLMDAIIA